MSESWTGNDVLPRRGRRCLIAVVAVAVWALALVPAAGATWTAGPSAPVPPGPPNGEWDTVSCLSASDCWVAGTATNADGLVAEHWNGSTWKVVTMPSGGASQTITSIACRAAGSCLAVGSGSGTDSVDYVWNGSAWSPGPAVAAASAHLNGVSCVPGGRCLVVGDYVPSTGSKQYALAAWWRPFSNLGPIGAVRSIAGAGTSLARASCPSSSTCSAVGSGAHHGISVQVNGGSAWSATAMPDGVDGFGHPSPVLPTDVSCTSSTACVAVGYYVDQATSVNEHPALLTFNATSWALVTGLAMTFPHGVSCVSATNCMLVGENGERDGNGSFAVAEHWDGTRVTLDTVDDDPSWASFFNGVACPTSAGCIAVGDQFIQDGPASESQPLMENSAGTVFSLSATPPPAGAGSAGFHGISCAGTGNCTAVGAAASRVNEHSFNGDPIPYAALWNGTRWILHSPTRTPGQKQILDAVSCPTTNACVAVGGGEPADAFPAAFKPLAERWDGHGWTALPVPSGLSGQWVSVSCVSATHCVALGTGAFEVWDGSTWTAQAQANASDNLFSVSCTALDACTAVGWGGGPVTFVERWNGTAWTEQAPSAQAPFVAVSCAAVDACQAMAIDASKAMGWDGTRWSSEPVSTSASDGELSPVGVDCATPRTCEAVGGLASTGAPYAFGFDGSSWLRQPLPLSLQGSGLDGVSCPARTACFAVGANTTGLAAYRSSPSASTSAPTGVAATAATLRGVVDPGGATVSSCVFRWGATSAYGHSAPCAQSVGSGFGPVPVSARVTGLVQGSTYHYRLVVTSPAGGAHGSDWVFSTPTTGDRTFGNAAVGDGASAFVANYKRANAYQLTEPASVVDLSLYLEPGATGGTQGIQGAIYADAFGSPGKLLGTTRRFSYSSTAAAGWWGLQFLHPLTLAPGRYWLAVLTNGSAGVAGWRYDLIGGSRDYNRNTFTAGFSDPFGPVTHDDYQMSLYADYQPSGSAAPVPAAHRTTARFTARAAHRGRAGPVH